MQNEEERISIMTIIEGIALTRVIAGQNFNKCILGVNAYFLLKKELKDFARAQGKESAFSDKLILFEKPLQVIKDSTQEPFFIEISYDSSRTGGI